MPLTTALPAHADASSQWPLQYLKSSQVWNITKGTGATVAVIDTGVAATADTRSALESGADFTGGTTSSGNGQNDTDGHGTSMAALIIGSGGVVDGFAPGSELLPVRATIGEGMTPDSLAAAIQYAVSQRVSVISISLRVVSQDSTLEAAIKDAVNANTVVIAAAGDEAQSTVDYPAAYPGVLAVGAVDQNGSAWSSSNTGPQLALMAPGVAVPTEDNFGSAGTTTGTSASTAYVSATAALIRATHPSWTAGQVIRDLIATADPASGMTAGQHSDQYGYGTIDPLKALEASAPADTSNPLLTSATNTASATATTEATGPGNTDTASSSSSSTGLIIGIVAAVIAAIAIIVLIIVLNRRNRNRPGGPGSGGSGGGGVYGGPASYGQQQQQNPYHQQQPLQSPYYGPPQGQQPPWPPNS